MTYHCHSLENGNYLFYGIIAYVGCCFFIDEAGGGTAKTLLYYILSIYLKRRFVRLVRTYQPGYPVESLMSERNTS